MRRAILLISACLLSMGLQAHPVKDLLERIDRGASAKFIIEQVDSGTDFFELDQKGRKVVVRGNNYVSIASGINWYLKYYAGIHLSWSGMKAKLPDVLPPVMEKEHHETRMNYRYYLNYCTYSYSMAFWNWERWEKEIDWMALHGINLPLAILGADVVWRNVLLRLGYAEEEADAFIAGPGFQAWWLMNNLEGWGGPCAGNWYKERLDLARRIIGRMKEFGIEPVFPGYSGMLPHDAADRLGLQIADPGLWNGYGRPAFLLPGSVDFERIASIYYEEQSRLFGVADYYSMDPFHEGGQVADVDLAAAGSAIWSAMKKANPNAAWVVQAWGQCPYDDMIGSLPAGDVVVLDLYSESRPQWGDPVSSWYRKNGFGHHGWLYCMLLNFGGNVGLHGKMDNVIEAFYKAKESVFGKTMRGTGLTMEGIGNNPVMYELFSELPWREECFRKEEWIEGYVKARYGRSDENVTEAWRLLANSIYNCPAYSTQQGTHESIFCARPSMNAYNVSSWSEMEDYYNPDDVIDAAGKMLSSAVAFRGNNNFEYDLVDIVRQAIAEKGRIVHQEIRDAYGKGDREGVRMTSDYFLELILLQDRLLSSRSEFMVGSWLSAARELCPSVEEKDWMEWNARVQITTWGNRAAAENGGLRDYAHKEWNGLLKDFYYPRWKKYFDGIIAVMDGKPMEDVDWYAMDEEWTLEHQTYPSVAEGSPIDVVNEVYGAAMQIPYGEMQKETRKVLYTGQYTITPDSSFMCRAFVIPSDTPVRRKARVVGLLDFPDRFRARGEELFRQSEFHIDDNLDASVRRNEEYSLYFKGENDDFERLAYYRIGGLKGKRFTAVLPVVKKSELNVCGDGFFGLEVEVFYKRPGRASADIYDIPDQVLRISVPSGSEACDVSAEFEPDSEIACLLLKAGGFRFSGECWIGSPVILQDGVRVADIPFARFEDRSDNVDYWAGCNLSTRSWPLWKLEFNGKTCFEGNIFDRASDVADFYITLPEWVSGDGMFTLTLQKEPHRASYPYILKSFELLSEPARSFEVVSVPEYITEGESGGILIETNEPSVPLTISAGEGISPAEQTILFGEPGLHVVPINAVSCRNNIKISFSDGNRKVYTAVRQIVRKGYDQIYLSSGDEIYVDKEEPLYGYFFKWYVSSRVGNWYQFRPSYQWSGFRICRHEFVDRYKRLLCGLNMPYAWQVDGRTLASARVNPPLDELESPLFRGMQAHENDGGYNYWRHFLYDGLYSDLIARARPLGGIFARHRPIYTSKGIFIHYDPYKVTDMADGARYLVNNLRYSKGPSCRHTGPSTLFRYLYQAGYSWLGAEQMYGPEELVMSSLRGASRAYSRPLYGSLHAMQWASKPFTDPSHALRLYNSLAVAYMHGSSHINTEEALWTDEYANDRYSVAGKQHLYAQNRILDFIQTHTRRGEQISRIAVIQGRNDAWNVCNRGSLWSQNGKEWEFNKASESFDLLKIFYPDHELDWCGPDNMFTSTPFGTIDLLPVEAAADVWKKYRVAVFLGWNTYNEDDFINILDFVRNGGTLVLTAAHFNSELRPDRPVRFPSDDALIRDLLGKDYRKYKGIKDLKCGDGRVIYFADTCYPADDRIRGGYGNVLRSLASDILEGDISEGWIKSSDKVSYTVWEHDGIRTFYLLNIGGGTDGTDRTAVWSSAGKDFTVRVRRYMIETVHHKGLFAVMPMADTSDVLDIVENGAGWTIVVQTTGPDTIKVMDAETGRTTDIKIEAPGIHNIPVK